MSLLFHFVGRWWSMLVRWGSDGYGEQKLERGLMDQYIVLPAIQRFQLGVIQLCLPLSSVFSFNHAILQVIRTEPNDSISMYMCVKQRNSCTDITR
jgi:hypothetical protein